jgi:simple sugar transport system permease protein
MTAGDWALFVQSLAAAGVARGTPLLYATVGEILAERSGVLNLGLEGLMLTGAMAGFGVATPPAAPGWAWRRRWLRGGR